MHILSTRNALFFFWQVNIRSTFFLYTTTILKFGKITVKIYNVTENEEMIEYIESKTRNRVPKVIVDYGDKSGCAKKTSVVVSIQIIILVRSLF